MAKAQKLFPLLGVVLLLLVARPGAVHAQEITGTISGRVQDSTGAVVVGATVTIKNLDKNIVARTATTNDNGVYSAPFLLAGHYDVTIEASGFKKFIKTGIELNVNDRLTVDVTLDVGDITEVITVEATPVQVELQTATAAGLISGTEVREIPLNNRNYIQLVTLIPGVSSNLADQAFIGTTNPSGQTNVVSIAINGGRSSQNNWTIDGADNVDRGSNLTLLNYPSTEAIAEFKVLRNHYSAEYGRNASGHVNVITKSGAKEFHGGAYEFLRNDKIAANTFFNNASRRSRPPLRYNNFGYTFGGPFYIPGVYNTNKDKTFFFWSQEFRRVITYGNFVATVPTQQERQGIFSVPVCVAATGNTCNQTATQITNINPVAAAYIQDIYSKLPLPNSGTNTLISAVRNIFNHRQELIRVDHNFSPRLTLAVRFLNDTIPTEEPGGLFTGNTLPGVATTKTDSPGRSWTVRSVQTFTPTLVNEGGYSYSYGAIISRPIGLNSTENSPNIRVPLPFTPTLTRVPTITPGFSGVTGFGPYDDFNRNHNIYDNLTKIQGRHTLKFGTSIHLYQKTENAGGNNVGSFTFATTPRPTGTATFIQQWANFLLGNVATFTQNSLDVTPDVRARQFEFYVQDDFRVRPNLTLNIGLRYSLFRQPYDENGQLTNFDPRRYDPSRAVQIDPATGNRIPNTGDPLNGIIQAGKKGAANEDYRDLAPVFGFAWDPFKNGKTAIRGGYGISFDTTLFGIVEQNIFTNPPVVSSVVISNTRLDNPAAGTPVISAAPITVRGTPYENQTPYIQQWSLDIQREVMNNFVVAVGYYGSRGTHLLGIVDLNLVPPGAAVAAGIIPAGQQVTSATTPRLNAVRPFKGYVAINAIQNWFNSNYNSMQVAIEKRFSGGSLIKTAYTWSHNLTDNQTDRSTAPQNFYDRRSEYGNAQLDRRHILTVSYVYELPWLRDQKGFAGHLLGGWQVSGITSYATGLPQTVTTTGIDPSALGFLGPSASGARPDMVGDPNRNAPHTLAQWFTTSAFAPVPTGVTRPGNAGRGVVNGPGYGRWDLALSKNIKVSEEVKLQFRAEAFNLFNHTNFATVSTSLTSATFGQITGTRDPRILQFGLKLDF
jgi:hypothetical protein